MSTFVKYTHMSRMVTNMIRWSTYEPS